MKQDPGAADRQYNGKPIATWRTEWERQYGRQMEESAPQVMEAAFAGRVPLAVADRAFDQCARTSLKPYRTELKSRFDALARDAAKTPAARRDMDTLLARLHDPALDARWQAVRRQALLDLAARTYLVDFRHVAPSADGKTLEPLTASAMFFETESEQFNRQAGISATSTSSPRAAGERERTWASLRESLETTVRDALKERATADAAIELRTPDDAELAELGGVDAAKGFVRGRIEVVAAWGFQGLRQRGRDAAGRIQYLDTYVPQELLVVATVATARGRSTWDGRHMAHAKADWTESDANARPYSSEPRKVTPEKQVVSQVKLTLEQDLPAYKYTAP
jgi:hypothetical protein